MDEVKVNEKPKYLRWVGDSQFDSDMDDPDFNVCNGENYVNQYFNFSQGLRYKGEKTAIVKHFTSNYKPIEDDKSGWLRIRFIVNCKGQTGRFRTLAADYNYQPQEFDEAITDQLLTLTKSLTDWEIQPNEGNPQDYYQYLTFKIEDGQLIEILP